MARTLLVTLIAVLLALLVLAEPQPRGHDAIAKRKRAALPDPEPEPEPDALALAEPVASQLEARSKPKKVCLAWTNEIPSGLKTFAGKPSVFGMYTWSPWCPDASDRHNIPCFPMFWGDKSISKWKALNPAGLTHVIGPNEVNQPGQSQMSQSHAASLWKQYMIPLKNNHGIKLISPSTSNAKSSIPWFQGWIKQCPTCHASIHAYATHYYGTNSTAFINYVTSVHKVVQKPIWITEVACQDFSGRVKCTSSMATKFMNEITAWMDSTSWIESYCWYGMFHTSRVGVSAVNSLLTSGGQLTALGSNYVY